MRMKNLELGYTLPKSLVGKIGISGVRVFVSAQNLFTLTRYKGFDPERAGVNAPTSTITRWSGPSRPA